MSSSPHLKEAVFWLLGMRNTPNMMLHKSRWLYTFFQVDKPTHTLRQGVAVFIALKGFGDAQNVCVGKLYDIQPTITKYLKFPQDYTYHHPSHLLHQLYPPHPQFKLSLLSLLISHLQ